jgi:hypothetical protein
MTNDTLREGETEYGNAGQGVQELSPGACRILESVSLWSNEEARSAEKIIAWAVRPRECEIKASSAEGATEIVAVLSRAMSAN